MKRFSVLLAVLLLLAGCAPAEQHQWLKVSIAEQEGILVLNNGQQVLPGEDAEFQLLPEPGIRVVAADYPGEYRLEYQNGLLILRLFNIQFPSRVDLAVTSQFQSIEYHPNGGEGAPFLRDYDMQFHARPNTESGLAFHREGCTLTGWNTAPDGTGEAIGLGSRATVRPPEALNLYAQWAKWSAAENFTWQVGERGAVITGYTGNEDILVIPAFWEGHPVVEIGANAFVDAGFCEVILPHTLEAVAEGAFVRCELRELTLFDNIGAISDNCFTDCGNLRTVHINAIEKPYGYDFRRESCLADKIDLLILNRGQKKLVCYGGCSMWYNLDGWLAQEMLGQRYRVVNVGINGVINSLAQMQILAAHMEPGDVFFHTPEFSSKTQMMEVVEFTPQDEKLWCGLEYNYDLVSKLDIRQFPNLLDSFRHWLDIKKQTSSYEDHYVDSLGRPFFDPLGGIPFDRPAPEGELQDSVCLDPGVFTAEGMARLDRFYSDITQMGIQAYVSYGAVNLDAVPEAEQENAALMEEAFEAAFGPMPVTVVSRLEKYLYRNEDFFDTNYHLLFEAAQRNTRAWMEDLIGQMKADGLWE